MHLEVMDLDNRGRDSVTIPTQEKIYLIKDRGRIMRLALKMQSPEQLL
jgi:hypothetical protein